MDALEEAIAVGAMQTIVVCIAQDGSGIGAAPRSACGGIPFERDDLAGRQGIGQAAFALLDLRLGLLAVGDVDVDADDTRRLAGLVGNQRSCLDPPDLAVAWSHDAE